MLLTPDARRRVTLPLDFEPGEALSLERQEDGTWRLIPVVPIPKHQLWALRPHVQAAIAKALSEPGISLDSPEGEAFLRDLEKE